MRYITLLLIFAFFQTGHAQTDTARVKLIFAGDIMGHDGQINGAWDESSKSYNYEPTFKYVKPYIEQADIAIANLEVTLAGPPYKGYPQFSSPNALAITARDAGFDVFIQANNHVLDRGSKGVDRTLNTLDSLNITHTGVFTDSLERAQTYPLMLEKNGIRIALLNYTYGTNGITIKKPYIVNYIDTTIIRTDLLKAKSVNPDFIIVTIHWGEEYQRNENRTQQNLAEFILKNGADIIIGSHPHVVQPVKLYPTADDTTKNHIVVFSQGNFVSNQRTQYRDGGILVELDLEKVSDTTVVDDFSYMPAWVYRDDASGKGTFYIIPVNYWENNKEALNLNEADKLKIEQFGSDTRDMLINIRESIFFNNPHCL